MKNAEITKVYKKISTNAETRKIHETATVTYKSGTKRTFTNYGALPKTVVMFMLNSKVKKTSAIVNTYKEENGEMKPIKMIREYFTYTNK